MTTALSTLLSPAPLARTSFAAQALAGSIWWLGVFAVPFVRIATLGSLDPVTLAVVDVPLFVVASALAAVPARWGRVAALAATAWTCAVTVFLVGYATLTGEAGWGVVLIAAAAIASTGATCLLWWGRIPTEWALAGPFAFRPPAHDAVPRGTWPSHLRRSWCSGGSFSGRWGLSAEFPWAIRVLGGVVLILASALGLWSAFAMSVQGDGTPLPASMANRLVVSGPYRFVRNPMAVAGCAQGAAVGLLMSSWLVVVYAVLGSLLWNYAARPLEEADLEQRFGDEFLRYWDAVRCWVPRLQRYGAPPGT